MVNDDMAVRCNVSSRPDDTVVIQIPFMSRQDETRSS
jgi:hypothetical protein